MVIAADNNLVEGCNVVVPVELTDSYFDAVDIHNRVDNRVDNRVEVVHI